MSDERLRRLETTWKESGADEDAVAYLAERVRAQGWPWERLVKEITRAKTAMEILAWWDGGTVKTIEITASDALLSREADVVGTGVEVEVWENGYNLGGQTVVDFSHEFHVNDMGGRVRVELHPDIRGPTELRWRLDNLEKAVKKLETRLRDLDHLEARVGRLER